MQAAARWLYRPSIDLLLGYGGAYLILIAAVAVLGTSSDFVSAATPFMLLALSVPHYGATLVRVYESRAARRKYGILAIWISLALIALFGIACRTPLLASALFTLHVMWGLWHYGAQNYGVAIMSLGRAEVKIADAPKRSFRWSFALSSLLAILPMQLAAAGAAGRSVASGYAEITSVRFLSFGISQSILVPIFWIVAAAYAVILAHALGAILRAAPRKRDVWPAGLLVLTQATWFVVPTVMVGGTSEGPSLAQNVSLAFVWIALAHAVQYLWISVFYAEKSKETSNRALFVLKAFCAGSLAWTLPVLIFAPGTLGRMPYDVGLANLVAALVNLHHYILDGAIWKLRDGALARILLRNEAPGAEEAAARTRPRATGYAFLYGLGGLCVVLALVQPIASKSAREARAARDLAGLEQSAFWLAASGADAAEVHVWIGQLRRELGDHRGAEEELRIALDMFENPLAWVELGLIKEQTSEWNEALAAYTSAAELDPTDAIPLVRSGIVYLKQADSVRAREFFLRAAEIDPQNAEIRAFLAKVN